eukprot:6195762-Pleurochrysis_carterae.AAC.4
MRGPKAKLGGWLAPHRLIDSTRLSIKRVDQSLALSTVNGSCDHLQCSVPALCTVNGSCDHSQCSVLALSTSPIHLVVQIVPTCLNGLLASLYLGSPTDLRHQPGCACGQINMEFKSIMNVCCSKVASRRLLDGDLSSQRQPETDAEASEGSGFKKTGRDAGKKVRAAP